MQPAVILSAALIALLLAAPAMAIEDQATGLAVDLPESEFVVEPSDLTGSYTANFGINTVSGAPKLVGGQYLCEVGFQPGPQNAGLSQAEINTTIGTTDWMTVAQGSMAALFDFQAAEKFELAGATGYEFIAVPKQDGAENVRVVLSMIETPQGRTAISCATDASQLDDALKVFRTIREAVKPPA